MWSYTILNVEAILIIKLNLFTYERFIISGQGSQVVGMGAEFYNNFEVVKKFFTKQIINLIFHCQKLF